MTVAELIELLEGCDPDAEVVIAEQPRYPRVYRVAGVEDWSGSERNVIYIVEGSEKGSLPREVAEASGWR